MQFWFLLFLVSWSNSSVDKSIRSCWSGSDSSSYQPIPEQWQSSKCGSSRFVCVWGEYDNIENILNINQRLKWVAELVQFTGVHKVKYRKGIWFSVSLLLPCWTGLILHGRGYYHNLGRFPCVQCFPFALLLLACTLVSFPVAIPTGKCSEKSIVWKFRSSGMKINWPFF